MEENNVVVLHHTDLDGFGSAWVFRKKFHDAVFIPVNYGQKAPDVRDSHVYVVDFSFNREETKKLIANNKSFTLLDHHKTAQEELTGLPGCHVDLTKSGIRLAWEHLFPGEDAHWLVDSIEDHDLWLFKFADTKEITAALSSYPQDFETWDNISKSELDRIYREGIAILRSQERQIEAHIKSSRMGTIGGYAVPVVNCTSLSIVSELGNRLSVGHLFAASYYVNAGGTVKWSLRSQRDMGVDVAEIAKSFGGGGHKNAAGFITDLNFLQSVF